MKPTNIFLLIAISFTAGVLSVIGHFSNAH